MRLSLTLMSCLGGFLLFSTGCAGPENKLGRGLVNATEFARLGEIRRSMEQTGLWEGGNKTYTTGFIRGFNRSLARTAVGIFEVATFPIPTPDYEAKLLPTGPLYPDYSIRTYTYPWGGLALPEEPGYPDSYKPGLISGSLFETDTTLGFSGGDVAPFIPGSRFRVFDN
jgi:putative exosortase-associated protein (TIGR04073 family)